MGILSPEGRKDTKGRKDTLLSKSEGRGFLDSTNVFRACPWSRFSQILGSSVWLVVFCEFCLTILHTASALIPRNQERGGNDLGQLLWKSPLKPYKNVLKPRAIFNMHRGKMPVKMDLF